MTRLADIGERRLVSEFLSRRYSGVASFGDDCARLLPMATDEHLVATTDPCPVPMAFTLGYHDYYYFGWLLATINLSDLAAAGARPLGVLTSLVLPREMEVDHLSRLLDGIDRCCFEVGTSVVGGNLKEGAVVDGTATAIGAARHVLSRRGARAGDYVLVIGNLGRFWAGALLLMAGMSCPDTLKQTVLTPIPLVPVGHALGERSLLSACIDNSDGLQPSLDQICRASGVGMDIEISSAAFSTEVRDASVRLGVDPLRLALGWGDWQLIGCCRPDDFPAIGEIAIANGVEAHRIGTVTAGSSLTLRRGSECGRLGRFESERFADDSWFSVGIGEYISILKNSDLIAKD